MARISKGRIELRRSRVDLNELMRQAADDFRSLGTPANLRIEVHGAPQPLWLHADAARITQVIGNLLHNAIKFTPGGGLIELSTRLGDGFAVLEVVDSGAGMDASQLARIFEPHSRSLHSPMHAKAGLGLGLSLVRGLVEMHEGSVNATSAGPGLGSAFRLKFPIAR